MLFNLITLAENAPVTGDDFPTGTLVIVGIVAVAVAAATAIFAKKKSNDDESDDDDKE